MGTDPLLFGTLKTFLDGDRDRSTGPETLLLHVHAPRLAWARVVAEEDLLADQAVIFGQPPSRGEGRAAPFDD